MMYEEFLEQTALEVWQMWNAGEVRWRDGFPQECEALHWGMLCGTGLKRFGVSTGAKYEFWCSIYCG